MRIGKARDILKERAYTYDALGNPTEYKGNELDWTHVRQLARYGSNIFEYGADGIRCKKNNITYALNGSRILRENRGTVSLTYYYGMSGVIGFQYDAEDYSYQKNLQGDITAIYNSYGALVAEYKYDAWGKILAVVNHTSANIGTINPFRYRGYYYDTETNLYYLQSRYYDPETGRFINADDVSYLGADGTLQSFNLFAYCGNNPVMHRDPTGRAVITLSAIAIAALIGLVVGTTACAAAGAAAAACNGTDVLAGLVSGAVGGAILGAGAGVGALFLAPIIAGGSVAFGIAGSTVALSTGAAIGTGLTIGGVTGAVGGATADLINQLWNNGGEWSQVDGGSIAVSAVEYGVLNMISTGLGGTLSPDLSNAMNLLGSKFFNVLPTGWGFAIDVIKNRL